MLSAPLVKYSFVLAKILPDGCVPAAILALAPAAALLAPAHWAAACIGLILPLATS